MLLDIISTPLIFASIIYIFYSVPKLIKSTELKRNVMFKECILETFLLLMFPIGIWIIQPRINKIFNE